MGVGHQGLPNPNPNPGLFIEFYVFWVLPVAPSRSSVRLRHIFVIPESGPLFCGLDRRTYRIASTADCLLCPPREAKGLPLHLESILTQQHISLTNDLPTILSPPTQK